MLLRSFSLNFEMNTRGLAAIDPEPPFRSATRKLPLTGFTLQLEILASTHGKL